MKRIGTEQPKKVFKVCLALAQEQLRKEPPKPKGRGHPQVYDEDLYLALSLFRAYFSLTFRSTTAFYQDLFPDEPCPTFQALHWFLKKKVKHERLEGIFLRLRENLEPFLPQEEERLFILDTTGLPHRGLTQRLLWRRGEEVRKVRGHSRFCALIRYFRKARLLLVEGVAVGKGYAPDTTLGMEVLDKTVGGELLADAGFDACGVWEKALGNGMKPHIRLKGGGEVRDERRKGGEKIFDLSLYRLRGIGEGLFGGIKTRLGRAFGEMREEMAIKRVWLEALCYNLRIYLTLFLWLLRLLRGGRLLLRLTHKEF